MIEKGIMKEANLNMKDEKEQNQMKGVISYSSLFLSEEQKKKTMR